MRDPVSYGWKPTALKWAMRPAANSSGLIKGSVATEPADGLFPGFSASGQDVWLDTPQQHGPGLILSSVGARCGKVFKADGDWGVVANTNVFIPQPGFNRDFLWYLINDESFWEKGGTAQPYVRVAETLARRILMPDGSTQRRIADFLDTETARIDDLIAAKRSLSSMLDEAFVAKVDELVTGRRGQGDAVERGSGPPNRTWRTAQLRNVVESISDGPFGSALSSKHYAEDGVRVIRLGNIGQGRFLDKDKAYVPAEYAEGPLAKYRINAGDVVMAGLGDERRSIGRACVVPAYLHGAIHKADCFRVRPSSMIRAEYLVAYLSSSTGAAACALLSQGTTRQRINTSNARSVRILVPALGEQELIVEEVDRLWRGRESIVEMLTVQLGLLIEYRQALITAAVTGQLDEAMLNGTRAVGMEVGA